MLDSESKKRLIEKNRAVRVQNKRELKPGSSDPHRRCKQEEALERKEIEFTKAQQIAAIGSFTVDLVTGEQEWSDQVFRMLGLAPGAIPATLEAFVERVHSEDRALLVEKSTDAFAGTKNLDHQYRIVRQDGQVRFVHTQANIEYGQNGKPLWLYGFTQDITERKKSERELEESEERYKALFKCAPDGIIVADVETGQYVHVNPSICERLGYSEEEIKGLSQFSGIHPKAETDRIKRLFYMQARGEIDIAEDIPFVRKDGTNCYFDVNSVCVEIDGIQQVIALLRDITDRKRAEEALSGSLRKLSFHLQNTPVAHIEWDLDFNVSEWNTAAEETFGYTKKEAMGKHAAELIVPESARKHVDNVWKALLKQKGGAHSVNENFTKKGETLICEWNNTPLTDNDGSVIGVASLVQDITEHKQAEEALIASETKYRSLFDNSIEGIDLSKGNRVISANRATLDTFGYDSLEEFAKIPLLDHVAPESREMVRERMKKREEGEPLTPTFEYRIIRKDGEIRDLEASSGEISIEGEKYTQSTFRDITERKRAENLICVQRDLGTVLGAVSDLEEGLGLCLEAALGASGMDCGAVYLFDKVSRVLSMAANRGLSSGLIRNTSRYDPDSLNVQLVMKGKPVYTRHSTLGVSLSDAEKAEGLRAIAVLPIIHQKQVIGCLNVASHTFDVEQMPRVSQEALESIAAQIGNAVARLQGEDTLRQSEERLKILFESAPDAYYIHDLEGRLVDGNRAAEELIGCQREEVIGKSFFELEMVTEADVPKVVAAIADNRAGRPAGPLELTVNRRDGSKVMVETRSYPVDIAGETLILGIARNITGRKQAEEALRESEERFRSLSESSPVGVFRTDEQGAVLYTNPQWQQITGLSLEESLGFGWAKALHPGDKDRILEDWDECLREERGYSGEFRFLTPSGQVRWVYTSTSPIRSARGNAVGHVGMNKDISERKLAEEALRESEKRLKILFESAPDAYYIHDLEGRFVDGNRAALELVGYQKEEAVGKSYFELGMIAEADIPKSSAALADNRDGKPAGPLELTINRKDGSTVTVETRSYPVDIAGETLILGIARNITERKRTVEALRQSENKFRTIFETAANLIGSVDKEGIIVDCNSRVKEFLGYDKDEIVGRSMAKVIHPDYFEKADEALREMASGGDPHDEEFQMVHKNGTLMDVSINASVLRDENGEFASILCVIDDITERKRARQRLLEYSEQLKSLASQLSLTEERERHRLATALHDHIGQSLVFSKLKLDQIRKSASSEELAEAMDEVCDQIGNVIADTRTLTFDLSSPILYELGFEAAVAEWLSDEIELKHGIKARFEDDMQPKLLDDDIRTVLFRNVRELLTNVVKHAEASEVKISLSRDDGNIRVRVEDDGKGFDPDTVASKAARRAEFGLFSIRERLSQLGGSVDIASEPNRGTRIVMTAPLKWTQTDNAPQSV